jgi:hypothetical protein
MVDVICVKSLESLLALELEDDGVAMLVRVPMASMVDVVEEGIKEHAVAIITATPFLKRNTTICTCLLHLMLSTLKLSHPPATHSQLQTKIATTE